MFEPSAAVSKQYLGCFIKQLPVLQPFKSQYARNNGSKVDVGVFIIIPFEECDGREILDLTDVNKDGKKQRCLNSRAEQKCVEVKVEAYSDPETSDIEVCDTEQETGYSGDKHTNGDKLVGEKTSLTVNKDEVKQEFNSSYFDNDDTDDYMSAEEEKVAEALKKLQKSKQCVRKRIVKTSFKRKKSPALFGGTKKRIKQKDSEKSRDVKAKKPWVSVELEDHSEKFTTETVASLEQRNRGSEVYTSRFSCLVCNNYKSVKKLEFEKHLEMHVNGKLRCLRCGFEAHTNIGLKKHRQDCLGDSTQLELEEHVCDICGHVSLNERQHKTHLGTMHDNPQYGCQICKEKFPSPHYRKKHRVECHAEILKYCSKCQCFFTKLTNEKFQEHTSSCSRELPCPECGKLYVGKMNLLAHQRHTHGKVRKHQCYLCPYSAKDAQKLREHIHARQGIHPYKCDQCTFSCVQPYQLKSHMRTHTGERPYKCDQCNYAAAWNVQLKDHKKAHSLDTAVMCEQCRILFKNKHSLSCHTKKEHPNYQQ